MNRPKIRFKGYGDDWEQRKLGSLVIDHNAGIYISKEDYGSGTNVIGVGNIYDNDIFDGEIYRLGPVNDDRFLLEENDLIYGESSLVPEGIARTVCVGKNGVGSAFAWHTRRVKLNQNLVNSHFATLEINYNVTIRKYLMSVSTQTALTGMTTDGYFGATLVFPSVKEQTEVSAFFKNLDHLITLHQRKCDETKTLKKYMLQKMFPQDGKKVPEIRFKGFTDDWEQRKLETVATFSKGSGYSKGDLQEVGTPIILYGRLYTKYETTISEVDTFVNEKSGSVYSKGGEVIIPASGETAEDIARAATVENKGILLGGDLNVITPDENVDSAFLALSISNGAAHKELASKAQGKSVVHIHNAEIQALNIAFPSKPEQSQISGYFANLDHLITLHQRKCDKLKEMKKYMLQNMFV